MIVSPYIDNMHFRRRSNDMTMCRRSAYPPAPTCHDITAGDAFHRGRICEFARTIAIRRNTLPSHYRRFVTSCDTSHTSPTHCVGADRRIRPRRHAMISSRHIGAGEYTNSPLHHCVYIATCCGTLYPLSPLRRVATIDVDAICIAAGTISSAAGTTRTSYTRGCMPHTRRCRAVDTICIAARRTGGAA